MSEEKKEFYANAVNVTTSIYDVTLSFRTQSPVLVKEGETPIVEASGIFNVRMSPQHAKSLAALLVRQIKSYERDFGTRLPLQKELEPVWKECIRSDAFRPKGPGTGTNLLPANHAG